MDVYNPESQDFNETTKPIHGSIVLLTLKLIVAIILFDIAYSLLFYVTGLLINANIELFATISLGLFLTLILKNIMQVAIIITLVLRWSTTLYYIQKRHLIVKKGILHITEDVYEFKTIRSLELDQSFLGRLLHYGNIILKTSASGGYHVVVTLIGLANPQRQEKILNRYF